MGERVHCSKLSSGESGSSAVTFFNVLATPG